MHFENHAGVAVATVGKAREIVADHDVVGPRLHLHETRARREGLFPHMSVAENVGTVPGLLGWPKPRIAARVEEMLALVGLDPREFARRFPGELSGGQRQRVGVARALAADPPVMLMDEPFGAVDPVVRERLQSEFLAILRRLSKTIILVTHDIDEAIQMGDRLALMRAGRLVQYDTPDRILAAPRDVFTAEFLGLDRGLKRLALAYGGGSRDFAGRLRIIFARGLSRCSGYLFRTSKDTGTCNWSFHLDLTTNSAGRAPGEAWPAGRLIVRSTRSATDSDRRQ